MSTKQTPAEGPKLIEVTLLAEHTHQGKKEPKGAKIKVNAAEQQWLIQQQIIADPNVKAE